MYLLYVYEIFVFGSFCLSLRFSISVDSLSSPQKLFVDGKKKRKKICNVIPYCI